MAVPLVFLPGLLCDEDLWRDQVSALGAATDCRVADFSTQDSIAAMAGSVLEAVPGRFAVAALSMGGYVAFEIMRRAPERVAKLALLNTKARLDTAEQTQRRKDLVDLARRGAFKGVTQRVLPQFVHEDRLADRALTDRIQQMAIRIGRDGFLRQQKAIMARADSLPTLVSIRCPTTVIGGRQDLLTPVDCHREMAAGIANARLTVIEDCGHLSPMERPDAVNEALRRWLHAV